MQIMNKISLDNTIKENATSVVDIFDDCVTKIRFKEGFTKSILYHTADIWLSKRQFCGFKKFLHNIGEKEFIITHTDAFVATRDDIPIFQISSDIKYTDYYNLPLYDTTLAFSKNSSWAMCIEEGGDYGVGIIAVKNNLWETFKLCFPYYKRDLYKYISEQSNGKINMDDIRLFIDSLIKDI